MLWALNALVFTMVASSKKAPAGPPPESNLIDGTQLSSVDGCLTTLSCHSGFGAGFGGFGAAPKAPPTLKECCRNFKSRLPKDTSVDCICGSLPKRSYAECCRPYHKGEAAAETPQQLLEARYAAFAYRLVPYIIETTDKTNADYMKDKVAWAKKLNKNRMFDGFDFVSLEIGEQEAGATDDEVFISPNVFTLRPKEMSKQPLVMRESTKFVRRNGKWFFASGAVTSEEAGLKGQVLESEKNVQKLQKDVNYVNTLIDQAKKKEPRGGQPSMMADEEEANLVQSLLIKGAVLAAIYFVLTLILPTPPPRV